MKSIGMSLVALMGGFLATTGAAFAGPLTNVVPEPGSIALVGVAIAALVVISRKGKK